MNTKPMEVPTEQDGKLNYNPLTEIQKVEQGLGIIDAKLNDAQEKLDQITIEAIAAPAPSAAPVIDQTISPEPIVKPATSSQLLLELKNCLRQARNELQTGRSTLVQVIGYTNALMANVQSPASSTDQPTLSDKEVVKEKIGEVKDVVTKLPNAISAACDTFLSYLKKPSPASKAAL